jgi:CubicO group peptidase (beta-lactamase class C family)
MKNHLTFSLIALLVTAALIPASISGQTSRRTRTSVGQVAPRQFASRLRDYEKFVQEQMARDRIPGMTIGFFKDDYTWVKGFGYADVENKTPAEPDSAYRIASTTKTMTGAAIVQLAQRGKIDLDAEIQTYVPDYPKQKWPVTVRQLLTHLGGGQGPSGLGPEFVSMKDLVGRLAKSPITVEPGTRFVYGAGAYNLLAAAVENISGVSFDKYLRDNLWWPAGMKETRIDDVRGLIPKRVRGYDLADGELKNAPFVDVSSRIGAGGVTSTVPDLLRWGRVIIDGKVLAPKWQEEMFKPVTTRAGRWSGIGDADEYYSLGWMIRPVNGNYVVNHGGSQKGTAAAFFVFPEKHLAISILSNLEFANLDSYLRPLFEAITEEEWNAHVFTKDLRDVPLALALNSSFNYGSLHYWQHHAAFTSDAAELATAFEYFNTNASREALRANATATARKIREGRHPLAANAFLKVGSYMAAKLVEKNGSASFKKYHTAGAIPFFADYVRLYKNDVQIPKEFRFTPVFEQMIEKWDTDWSRTWNQYTRSVSFSSETDFNALGARLRKEFEGAEVYPDFTADLQRIQQGDSALSSSKLGVELYPTSDEVLFNLGYFLIMAEQTEAGRAATRRLGQHEKPLVYFRRAYEANPSGVMAAGTFLDLGRRWLRRPEMLGAANDFVSAGLDLHPKSAALYELLGDVVLKRGQRELAIENYRKAYQLDPQVGKGASLDDYVATRIKVN